jgi:hypothetical protein
MTHGLLYRVKRAARQIGEQHTQLDEILRALRPAIVRGDAAEARSLIVRYRLAIEAHFTLEEDVFFPALHGLHPRHAKDLELLGAEHAGFRQQLDRLGALLDSGLGAFEAGLGSYERDLAVHETREERLVRELADLSGPPTD